MYGTLISTQTLATTASSVTFSSIPATYTDLVLVANHRITTATVNGNTNLNFNGDTAANYTLRTLNGTGSTTSSSTFASNTAISLYQIVTGASATASTFSNIIVTVPNYAGSSQKTVSIDGISENNASAAGQAIIAGIWTGTAAITTLTLTASFDVGSTFSLYGLTHF